MKYFYATFFCLCITQYAMTQQVINSSLTHNGITRNYILFIPGSYDPATPAPLVFSFHGYSSNAALNMNYTGFTAISDTAGFILVHPDGTLDATGTPHWNVGGWTVGSTTDDIGFTDQMITEISNDYNINSDRIYSTGMSNGDDTGTSSAAEWFSGSIRRIIPVDSCRSDRASRELPAESRWVIRSDAPSEFPVESESASSIPI